MAKNVKYSNKKMVKSIKPYKRKVYLPTHHKAKWVNLFYELKS